METDVWLPTDDNIDLVAELLKKGEVCAIPTETVYGLAANALDPKAVGKIFLAKGRPQDNPLIVHIASMDMLTDLVQSIPPAAQLLAAKFWPGPLTMIFQKSDIIPESVTAGLNTIAVRYPSHKIALAIIKAAGVPLAAPSANLSGSPSPTKAIHVYNDLNGRIPAIMDGGSCEVGLESTVVLLRDDGITLLRPGAVTMEMLTEVLSDVTIDDGVLHSVDQDAKVVSPGMKHQHYAPHTNMFVVDGELNSFTEFVNSQTDRRVGAMVFDGEDAGIAVPCVTFGNEDDSIIQAKLLFSALRAIDKLGVEIVYARMPSKTGMGLGVYNRLIRACGFDVITL